MFLDMLACLASGVLLVALRQLLGHNGTDQKTVRRYIRDVMTT